jgi:hypothetical protein
MMLKKRITIGVVCFFFGVKEGDFELFLSVDL